MVWRVGMPGLLVWPAFPLRGASGWAGRAGWTGSGRDGRWQALAEDAVPEGEPGIGPGPVCWQVQHGLALRLGDPGGDGDDGAAQCRAAGDVLDRAGHRAGGSEQVVADRRADRPRTVGAEPARREVRQ